MIKGKKIIGFCITKIQDRTRTEIVDTLYTKALEEGYKLIVFNSLVDFFNNDSYDEGASIIYDLINFDVLDALIVHYESFYNKKSIDAVVERAHIKGIPVIILKGEKENCFNIVYNCKNAYKNLIKHVIVDHNVRDLIFMSGRRDEQYSVERLKYFKEVLAENGIKYTDDMLYYGDYWYGPTKNVVNQLIDEHRLPRAIICANDNMAVAAIETIKERGYSVPEDCIVTGYDGTTIGSMIKPRLSTCVEDTSLMSRQSIEVLKDALEGKIMPQTFEVYNTFRIAGSCGCVMNHPTVDSEMLVRAYKHIEAMEENEYETFRWNTRISEVTDINLFFSFIARMIKRNSYVCVNKDLLNYANRKVMESMYSLSEEVVLIPSDFGIDYKESKENELVKLSDIVYKPEEWVEDDSMYVITMINAGNEPCGFFASKSTEFHKDAHIYNRASETINNAFNALIIRLKDISIQRDTEDALFIDPITKLPNIKGAEKWFSEFKKNVYNRSKQLAVSVYGLPKYKYIYENFGINEIELAIRFVSEALRDANDTECFVARITEDEFLIINTAADGEGIGKLINHTTKCFFESLQYFNTNKPKTEYIEVNCGCHVADPGWSDSLENYIRLANNAMYLNRLEYYKGKTYGDTAGDFRVDHNAYSELSYMIEKNLFHYHFQPVVNARTGEIYGYEALMRSGGGVSMTPLQILETAESYGRLYDIEKLTLFNILQSYADNYDLLEGKKVFINTIPGHFLSEEDRREFITKYRDFLDSIVFEITEQDSVSDEEVNSIRGLSSDGNSGVIAVDDYGTGHSNIINLFRYSPRVIKVDRFLISNIDTDSNKQMFVKNTVEFAAQNDIKVLAEGVETVEELRTCIRCGVDYIQGFYTGRPKQVPVTAIESTIHDEIVAENVKQAKFDNDLQVYNVKSGEIVNLIELAARKITSVNVPEGKVLFVGDRNNTVEMAIFVEDSAEVEMTLSNVNIKGTNSPCINLGMSSSVKLTLDGDNMLNKAGIYVHPTAGLEIVGDGNLTVNNNRNHSVGIGANFDSPFGTLEFNGTGVVKVNASGEKVIGIGGGDSAGDGIIFKQGNFVVTGRGINVIGIGSAEGRADINIGDVNITTNCNGNEAVSIGTLSGRASLVNKGSLNITTDGERVAGIGTTSGYCDINFAKGPIESVVHCDIGVCIGNIKGASKILTKAETVKVYGEGTTVCGIGSINSKCTTVIEDGDVVVDLLCGNMIPFGGDGTNTDLLNGKVRLTKEASHNIHVKDGELIIG